MAVPVEQFPDLRGLGAVLLSIEQQFLHADYTQTLEPFIRVLAADHGKYFASSKSPAGEPWKPLSPRTIAKKGHDTILVDTQRLLKSLISRTGDSVREVTHRGLIFGTSVPYSIFHQVGVPGRNLPQRAHVGITDETIDAITNAVADATVEKLKATT